MKKFNKNNFQIFSLLIAAIGIIVSLFAVISQEYIFATVDDSAVLFLITIMITLLTVYTAILVIFQRVNPKKNIYISYSREQTEIVKNIVESMQEQFNKSSKYRFELLTADDVPYGCDMKETIKSYIEKSDIAIVSKRYINSDWCRGEFSNLISEGKMIIPIVTESFGDLSQLPVNISHIKALSLIDATDEEAKDRLSRLVLELIKQRKD